MTQPVLSTDPGSRPGIVLPAAAAAIGFAILFGLGCWQLERRTWKEGLISALAERVASPPVALPPATEWPRLSPERDEFRRVFFAAEFLHAREALVYTAGSALRSTSGPGYWVFTPARLASGEVVMINRGFVPEGRQSQTSRLDGQMPGRLRIEGALRFVEARPWLGPADDPSRNIFFARDPKAIALAKGISDAAPFYVEQEAPAASGGLPQTARLSPTLSNNHLQYALTWFGLAATLAAVFAAWIWKERSQARN